MNESIIKETIMYDKYYIHWSYKSNKIICDCHNGIIAEKVNISKEKIYNSIKKLGSDIYTLLKKDLLNLTNLFRYEKIINTFALCTISINP